METVATALNPQEIDVFQTDLIVDRKCSQGIADYIINSDSFSLDECLNESYGS